MGMTPDQIMKIQGIEKIIKETNLCSLGGEFNCKPGHNYRVHKKVFQHYMI